MLKIETIFKQFFNQEYRFLVPEVVQTSAMDCGPAALKSVLAGFNISADYGQLREICQTDVDGTSIDTLEEISNQLGLQAEQILVPTDHLLLPEMQSLPAIIVVKTAGGLPHFIVIWNKIGPLIQLMDPGTGRRWVNQQRLFKELYIHNHPLPISIWREWAGSEGFYTPLQYRIEKLATEQNNITVTTLLNAALQDKSWYALATLDAATRMVETLVKTKGIKFGEEAINVLKQFFEQTLANPKTPYKIIPSSFWLVQLTTFNTEEGEPILIMQGAVLVRIVGLRATDDIPSLAESANEEETHSDKPFNRESILETVPKRPDLEIIRLIREDGLLTPFVLLLAFMVGAISVVIQALLLNNILNISKNIATFQQQLWAVIILFIFLLFLDIPILAAILRMGRQLEVRFRITILEKIPLLGDRYFRSRLNSDIAQRIHEMRSLRTLPLLATQFLRAGFEIIFTTIGLIWFYPNVTTTIALLMLWTFFSSFIFQPILTESDLRVQTHAGALSRFYLDSLLGLISIRSHSAEKAIRREHENLLVSWAQASDRFDHVVILIQAINSVVSLAFVIWIVYTHIISQGSVGNSLLLLYWLLNLPVLAQNLANIAQQYPLHRNRVLRLLDPLNAVTETEIQGQAETKKQADSTASQKISTVKKPQNGVAINLENVSVKASGQTILHDVNLAIKPSEHVAIVGLSGAGKSTLAGLLLGWHKTSKGRLLIDGELLTPEKLSQLHQETAWVDPAIQIWNKSLLNNLEYGHSDTIASDELGVAIEQADLISVLQDLPNGQQTILGEGGGLVSGGEGQRVRFGRAILRNKVRLVILDEPFRGLGLKQRQTLLKQARQHWQNATFIFISHDIVQSQQFERVIVIEDGAVAEIDSPENLIKQTESRYNNLLKMWQKNQTQIWSATYWRKLWLNNQQLDEN